MCGLVVFLDPKIFPNPETEMALALRAIKSRGIDDRRGIWLGNVGIGHVRLPIRGLGAEYDQPFVLEGHKLVGAVVGEIFGTTWENDSLYVLDLLHTQGPDALAKHDGFWSIVMHYPETNKTYILVDHLGIKPLYYHTMKGIVASELRAIEAVDKHMTLNPLYLSNVLKWGYDPTYRTPYQEVIRMEAGCLYAFDGSRLTGIQKYFPLPPMNYDLRAEIEEATNRRLTSDVPLAALCSGGLDSTIVSLLAAKYSPNLTVFHIENDEAEFVEAIDWPSNVTLKKLHLTTSQLDSALVATEEPVDLGSVLPQYLLGKAVKNAGFKVVLTGDGADELFGGYTRAREYDSQWSDIFCELVHYHLPRLDKTMMASTVELRSPFLAPRVIQAALQVPYKKRTKKQILKELFRDIVPVKILERAKKPLKTKAVVDGGLAYRQDVVNRFLQRKGK